MFRNIEMSMEKDVARLTGEYDHESGQDVLAIFCSDLHLSENAPPARSAEPDWLEAQWRTIGQLYSLQGRYECPVICAGDVFDRHNPSPALINWAIEHLPRMYAIPGQHDLPHHRYQDLQQSAYWTLQLAGILKPMHHADHDGFRFTGFPWETDVKTPSRKTGIKCVAVSHRFVWTKTTGYPGAPESGTTKSIAKLYKGYDVAVFGDNHQGFRSDMVGGPGVCERAECDRRTIFNCGCLIRRKANERAYRPRVGLLLKDGIVVPHYLDLTGDLWADQPDDEPEMTEMVGALKDFVAELGNTEAGIPDFKESMERWVRENDCSDRVRKILLEVCQ